MSWVCKMSWFSLLKGSVVSFWEGKCRHAGRGRSDVVWLLTDLGKVCCCTEFKLVDGIKVWWTGSDLASWLIFKEQLDGLTIPLAAGTVSYEVEIAGGTLEIH